VSGARLSLIATATFGLESVVARELQALGYESRALRPGWLSFEGDESAVARANLWLRASDRVLLQLASFPAADFDALFDGARGVAWEHFLPRNASIPVRGRSVRSALASVPACQSIVKKAIVERLKAAYKLERLPEDGPAFPVEVALLKDEAILVLDTTGAGLHKRGYRLESGEAPLKETLAAGLVLLSHWNRDRPFLDPFCGAGTLAIEAALIGRNRAPGRDRSFAAESWPFIATDIWKRAREEARDREQPAPAEPLEASDRDERVLVLARRSALKASVAGDVRFARRSFSEVSSHREFGCLITNPPYAGRIGEEEEVREVYRAMPGVFRRLPTWSFFILTARRDFEKVAGQSANRRRKLYNGDVECTYFQFLGPRPGREEVSKQAFGGIDARAERQAEIFGNRLRKRAHHLRKWPSKRGTDVYRLYDRDIKEVPLALDRYGDSLLLIPSSDPLESRTRGEHEDWLDLMARTASETLGVPLENVFIQGRSRRPRGLQVRENGLQYEVLLSGGRDTELDPALRVLRQWLKEEASGKRVLILGSRASMLALPAASGGARSTTDVDPEESSSVRVKRSFALNGVEPNAHRFVRSDVEKFLRGDRGTYDLAAIEVSSLDGHVTLLGLLACRMAPSGVAYLVTRAPRPKLDVEALSAWSVEDVTAESLPEDFRSRRIHRVWRLVSRVTEREELISR
jgi:23S rRNA G2445 N2-methylase RlmL/23S rRNA G2069 N7-methylase RlmK/C1962 C5-methylase RlmI